jgi:probable rRNA maturation factor
LYSKGILFKPLAVSFMVKSWVRFSYADRSLSLRQKRKVQSFVANIFVKEHQPPCQLQYVFCSDEFLYAMNVDFLKHDTYTDIITFDLSDDRKKLIAGEIYISVDRVAANALELGLPFEQEVLRVIFHGALHLCGYSDKTKTAKAEMRSKEDYYLNLYASQ